MRINQVSTNHTWKVGDTFRLLRSTNMHNNNLTLNSTGIVDQVYKDFIECGIWRYSLEDIEYVGPQDTCRPDLCESTECPECTLPEYEHAPAMSKAEQVAKAEHYDMISPTHYSKLKISPLEVIEANPHLSWCKSNAIKYIMRAGLKPGNSELQDLQKALWYLTHEIERISDDS